MNVFQFKSDYVKPISCIRIKAIKNNVYILNFKGLQLELHVISKCRPKYYWFVWIVWKTFSFYLNFTHSAKKNVKWAHEKWVYCHKFRVTQAFVRVFFLFSVRIFHQFRNNDRNEVNEINRNILNSSTEDRDTLTSETTSDAKKVSFHPFYKFFSLVTYLDHKFWVKWFWWVVAIYDITYSWQWV